MVISSARNYFYTLNALKSNAPTFPIDRITYRLNLKPTPEGLSQGPV